MADKIVDLSKANKDKNKNPFFVGDVKEAGKDSFLNVIIPAAQRLVVDTVRNWIESLVYGGSRPSTKSSQSTSYASFWGNKTTTKSSSDYSAAKVYAKHNVNDFINYFDDDLVTDDLRVQGLNNARAIAEKVCFQLHHDWSEYGCYSVLDFCDYTGQTYTAQANEWGWNHEPIVVRSGRGWKINLGEPIKLSTLR